MFDIDRDGLAAGYPLLYLVEPRRDSEPQRLRLARDHGAARGVVAGLALSLPLWATIAWIARALLA